MREADEAHEPASARAGDSRLIEQLEKNYLCLHRHYRLGRFERNVAYTDRWRPAGGEDGLEAYDLCEAREETDRPSDGVPVITFKAAVDNLDEITSFVEKKRPNVAEDQAVLLLRCKCLVYEAYDYWLRVPRPLSDYFIEHAKRFPRDPAGVEQAAKRLSGGDEFENADEQGKVIKLLLIAALCGINELYRKHGSSSYDSALHYLTRLERYIENELPRYHVRVRKSYGLIGLTQYLAGRVLSARGDLAKSRKAFRRSAEAYAARLRQKEEFLRSKDITPREYEEKLSVTLRRTALVTAFGDGYLSFVSSRLTRALESLTLARAALSLNSGRVYLTYVDMLYWACRRAAHTLDPAAIEEVVQELKKCRETFRELVEGSHYFHRAGLQLALALFYRAKLAPAGAERDYREGMACLDEAIEYAGTRNPHLPASGEAGQAKKQDARDNEPRNPHLLASALVTKSRFLSSLPQPGRRAAGGGFDLRLSELKEAEKVAQQARDVSTGIREVRSEAWATLGDVYADLAELYQEHDDEEFNGYFDRSLESLQDALKENSGENVRIDGICYLRLTRLFLLKSDDSIRAHEYFEQWRKIADEVEHEYWKRKIAIELEEKLRGPVLIVKAWDTLNYAEWEKRLRAFLHEEALETFVERHEGINYTDRELRRRLVVHLRALGYSDNKIYEVIDEEDLVEKLKRMRVRGPKDRARKKPQSYTKKRPKPEK